MSFKLNKELENVFAEGRCRYWGGHRFPVFLLTADFLQRKTPGGLSLTLSSFAFVVICFQALSWRLMADVSHPRLLQVGTEDFSGTIQRLSSGLPVLIFVVCMRRRLCVAFEAMLAQGRWAYLKPLLLVPTVSVSKTPVNYSAKIGLGQAVCLT